MSFTISINPFMSFILGCLVLGGAVFGLSQLSPETYAKLRNDVIDPAVAVVSEKIHSFTEHLEHRPEGNLDEQSLRQLDFDRTDR